MNGGVPSEGLTDAPPEAEPRPYSIGMVAVVVTFNPGVGFDARLSTLCAQFDSVIVVDNASSPALQVEGNVARRARFIANTKNMGIARAFNQGVAEAVASGAAWVATFDQDTEIQQEFRARMEEAIVAQPGGKQAAMLIGANYYDAIRMRQAHPPADRGVTPALTLISSGMVMPANMLERIGGFREAYFIDSVDHEFCLRARRNRIPVLRTRRVLMSHRIGASGRGVLGRALSSHHPATRKYSIARNAIATALEYRDLAPLWAVRQALRVMAEALGITLFERDRRAKLCALWQGVRDGFRKRSA